MAASKQWRCPVASRVVPASRAANAPGAARRSVEPLCGRQRPLPRSLRCRAPTTRRTFEADSRRPGPRCRACPIGSRTRLSRHFGGHRGATGRCGQRRVENIVPPGVSERLGHGPGPAPRGTRTCLPDRHGRVASLPMAFGSRALSGARSTRRGTCLTVALVRERASEDSLGDRLTGFTLAGRRRKLHSVENGVGPRAGRCKEVV